MGCILPTEERGKLPNKGFITVIKMAAKVILYLGLSYERIICNFG